MSSLNLKRLGMAAVASLLLSGPTLAQNLFSTVVNVNDGVITEFEIQQRIRFLRLLNAQGATRDSVTEALIDDRLRAQATSQAGLELTEEGIDAGMTEFAARADLSKDEFVAALAQSGVSEETFRDFVITGIEWRELIRARYGSRVEISEAEIDRALSATGGASGIRVLISEIIIPAPPNEVERVQELAERIAASESESAFSSYAREYSATESRSAGGRLPWQDLTNLPVQLRPLILNLSPGQITDPLPITNAIALFQLRDIQETGDPTPEYGAIEYAIYYIPGGRSAAALAKAAEIKAQVDICDDLYGIAKDQPEELLERATRAPSEIPADIAIELSKLDRGEVSTALTSPDGQALAFLMLCGRTSAVNTDVPREDVAQSLRQSRLSAYADTYLEELRAEARIVFK